MFSLGILSIQCKILIRRNQPTMTFGDQSIDAIDLLVTLGLFQHLKLYFWLQFEHFYLRFYTDNLC